MSNGRVLTSHVPSVSCQPLPREDSDGKTGPGQTSSHVISAGRKTMLANSTAMQVFCPDHISMLSHCIGAVEQG